MAQSDEVFLQCDPTPGMFGESDFDQVFIISEQNQTFEALAIGGAGGRVSTCGFSSNCEINFTDTTISLSSESFVGGNFVWTHDLETHNGRYEDRRQNESYDYSCSQIDAARVDALTAQFNAEREQAQLDRPYIANFDRTVEPVWGPSLPVDNVILGGYWTSINADDGLGEDDVSSALAACASEDIDLSFIYTDRDAVLSTPGIGYRVFGIEGHQVPGQPARLVRLSSYASQAIGQTIWADLDEPGPTHHFLLATFAYSDQSLGAFMQAINGPDRLAGDAYFRCGNLSADFERVQQSMQAGQ